MKDKKETALPIYEFVAEEHGFAVHRNGRYLMTPAGGAFRVPTAPLAEEIANEWRAQTDKIVPALMPMTQLAATSLDIVAKDRGKITRALLAYINSELLCHRTATPPALAQKQEEMWQPFLDWCIQRYDVGFVTGCGVMPIEQSPDIAQRLHKVIESYDSFRLAGLSSATDSAGSFILGLALADGFATAATVFEASELDIEHQAATWGDDPVTKARQDSVKYDLDACERWFGLLAR